MTMTGALVFQEVMVGIAEASATRRPATRYTRQSVSSTVAADRGRLRVSRLLSRRPRLRVGRTDAGAIVTIVVEDHHFRVLDGIRVLSLHARTLSVSGDGSETA